MCQDGYLVGRKKKEEDSNKVSKVQQDRDKKAARMGLKWGKSGGVTEGENGVLAVVSRFATRIYKRFSMRD